MHTRAATKTDTYIGQRIRMRRLTLNVSQAELGDALGVSFQQVQKYEKGVNRVSSSRLQQIADALKTTVPYFYEGQPGKHGTGTADDLSRFLSLGPGVDIARAYLSLPEDSKLRHTVRDVIVGIVQCHDSMKAKAPQRRAA